MGRLGPVKNVIKKYKYMLEEKYKKEIILKMKQKFGYKNDFSVPKIKKVVVNVGIGSAVVLKDEKAQESIIKDLTLITGQKPLITLAKKAISAFKIREGMPVGLKVTLRGKRMYDFLFRLINVVLPRTRDFRGLGSKSIDKGGNLSIGIKEHLIFPEISQDDIRRIFGMEITVVTHSKDKEKVLELYKLMGFPIK